MPELPEVQTVVSGIKPSIVGTMINSVQLGPYGLRHPFQGDLISRLVDKEIQGVTRRAKYIIIKLDVDLIVHLGMSGKLTLTKNYVAQKHDHVIISLSNGITMVYNDPRRFGMFFWHENAMSYLNHYGVEPLSEVFCGQYLYEHAQKSRAQIKILIMDQRCVVGVGNIYACEALFDAKISPIALASDVSLAQCQLLVNSIKTILCAAIEQGGTTLKDYRTSDNTLGYFQQTLCVYGQANNECSICQHPIVKIKQSGRATYFCEKCQ